MAVREDKILTAVHDFFADRVFGPDRLKLFAIHFSGIQIHAHAEHAARVATLETPNCAKTSVSAATPAKPNAVPWPPNLTS